ncbi:hypothetical protein PSU4_44370 [Pseudonocardia sulfidoxydans NBRC 16205]|uniref:DUF308 domain-containing protein n=1 Tax=Pseudonocardia sulfidoxydans NBRC 16205 TaxID=1223511 RepID=A0A511DMK5_9PSEU|nr:hypothetical protein [Pseudonocardia sulfidoxydans]GEL25483.1 hypothetical protein PSU4_44370 [Pseudonocardia sulfidoxydans NBRC 16205]
MNHDPDDRGAPGTGGSDRDHEIDEFDRIVAAWRSEGSVPEWPDEDAPTAAVAPVAERPTAPRDDETTPARGVTRPQADERPPDTGSDPGSDTDIDPDEHFVPPEPPPLPRLGPPAIVGIALLALGLLLVVAPSVLGMSSVYGLPLGLLSLAAGLGWLVLRLWPTPADDDPDEDDDGAVL